MFANQCGVLQRGHYRRSNFKRSRPRCHLTKGGCGGTKALNDHFGRWDLSEIPINHGTFQLLLAKTKTLSKHQTTASQNRQSACGRRWIDFRSWRGGHDNRRAVYDCCCQSEQQTVMQNSSFHSKIPLLRSYETFWRFRARIGTKLSVRATASWLLYSGRNSTFSNKSNKFMKTLADAGNEIGSRGECLHIRQKPPQ